MGADIHGVLQVSHNGERWRTEMKMEDGRNYLLFSALAGVRSRGDITPIDDSRGFPEGFELDGNDLHQIPYGGAKVWMGEHSFSWLSLDELLKWEGWDQAVADDPFDDEDVPFALREYCDLFHKWLAYADLKTSWCKHRRIVFGFDS